MGRLIRITILLALLLSTAARAESFVWRVDGASNTVYLAGSMHWLPERAYPLPGAYGAAYDDADMLVVEADQRKLQSAAARRQMMAAARYTEGGLADHLDAALYRRTRAALEENGLSIDRMNTFRPWFVSIAIELQSYRAQGFRPDLGLDAYFHERAVDDGKPILPLRPMAAHLAVFTKMPAALSRDQLKVMLDYADQLADAPLEIYRYWRSADAAGLARSVDEQAAAYPALYNRLVFDRNEAWLLPITALLQSPLNAFVLVGAVHLVGERGLVSQLRERGYRVERME